MRLTKNELSYLAKTYQGTNPLALFSSVKETLRGDEEKTLEAKGILKGGKPAEEAHKLLTAAAEPQKCTRLILKDGVYFIEKYAYRTKDDHVLAENDGGDVVFSREERMDEILFQLSQWTGTSDFKTFDLEMTISNHELLVFFAVADLRRETELLSYLGKGTENMISLGRIREQLQNPVKGSLTSILTGHYSFPVPNEEETIKILENLTAKKITASNAGYALVGPYEEFARNFLIPQSIALLETFHMAENQDILGAGVLCIWAGMREILSLVFREDEIEIVSVSGRQLLKMMEDFLNCPDVL